MWTLSDIRSKVRLLTGRPSTSDITDAALDNYINNYYVYMFPQELRPRELRTWFTTSTVNGTGVYGLDTDMLTVDNPVTIDGTRIDLYMSAETFFSLYPRNNEGTDTYSEPTAALWFDRELYLRPIPDDEYTVKACVYKRPDPLEETTDTPTDLAWGNIISYGAAIDILLDASQGEEAAEIIQIYEGLKSNISVKNVLGMNNQQVMPKW